MLSVLKLCCKVGRQGHSPLLVTTASDKTNHNFEL